MFTPHHTTGLRRYIEVSSHWCESHLRLHTRIMIVCVVVGLLAGSGAWLLKFLIRTISETATSSLSESRVNVILIALPVVGILLAGWMQRRLFRRQVNRGTERLRLSLKEKDYKLPSALIYEPIAGCAVTVGMGGSAGAEGPIAYAGAAIGSNTARFFGLDHKFIRLMVGIGAAAGIAGIFKSPLGGMFFTLEVLTMSLGTYEVLAMAVCCLISAGTSFMLAGMKPEIVWSQATVSFDYGQTLWLIPIAIVVGLYCRWYLVSGVRARKICQHIKHPGVRNLLSGLFIGILVFAMPVLYGEGYQALVHLLDGKTDLILNFSAFRGIEGGWGVPLMLVCVLAVKGMAVYVTNNGGGVSGAFAPTLFAGGMAGTLTALGTAALGCTLPASQIAYLCMGAAMAGIVRAPLMATFITVEITGTYTLLMPVAIMAFVSYFVVTGIPFKHLNGHRLMREIREL